MAALNNEVLGVQRTRTAINAISTEEILMARNVTRIVKGVIKCLRIKDLLMGR